MKKKSKKVAKVMVSPMEMPAMPKRTSIEKAENGFIVSRGYGEKSHVAKTYDEAQKIQKKLLK